MRFHALVVDCSFFCIVLFLLWFDGRTGLNELENKPVLEPDTVNCRHPLFSQLSTIHMAVVNHSRLNISSVS